MHNRASACFKKHMALITFALILMAWIAAWIAKLALDSRNPVFGGSAASFVYWTCAKLLIWILPGIYLVKRSGRTLRGLFSVTSWKKLLIWSGAAGGLLAVVNVAAHWINHTPVIVNVWTFAFINAVVIAPVFEEFTMRGAIFYTLRQRCPFFIANTIAAALFVLLHCPGWYFHGNLFGNGFTPVGTAASIFAIGWLCGLAAERGKSVFAAMIVHFLNNLTA